MFYIYILESEKTGKFYIGYSKDPQKRLLQHNINSENSYTSKFRPWQLRAIMPVDENEAEAVRIERYIKKQKQRRFTLLVSEKSEDTEFIKWLKMKAAAG